jgi:hypothetical protein
METPMKAFSGVLALSLLASILSSGCGGSPCGSHLASPLTGSGGLTVELAGISNGSSDPCSGLASGSTCNFTAAFTVSHLTEPVTAQLAVEICTDASGNSFSSENPGQSPVFIQADQVPLAPDDTGGSLQGTLGPPVSSRVRFALQVDLIDSEGRTVAASERVVGLAPK